LLDTKLAQRRVFTVNKAQLIDKLSGPLGSKKAATDAVDGVLEHITRAVVAGERVALTGFGVFDKVHRPARVGRNPRTGAAVKIKKTSVPKFKAGQSFKDVVSGAKKLPKAAAAAPAKKAAAKKAAPAKRVVAKKVVAKKASPAKKAVAKKVVAKKAAPAKKVAAKKVVAKKVVAKKAAPAKKAAAKKTAKKVATR
jgi:DNA-binding protein HU-beta